MAVIKQKITGFDVVQPTTPTPTHTTPTLLNRPERVEGRTYKIKTPLSEDAFYITINNVEVDGKRRPIEIFINSKNQENYTWVIALTRIMSAIFRHGGDITFIVGELRSIFDPKGGYFKPGGRYVPSLVAEIGDVIEKHLIELGLTPPPPRGPNQREQCPKCNQISIIRSEGCVTCSECEYSKCG